MFEFIKENKKWIYIIIVTIVFFILISKIFDSCSHSAIDALMNEAEVKTESIKRISMVNEQEAQKVLKGIAIKNGDWTDFPLSKEFLEKYNSRDGIFLQYDFEDVQGHRLSEEIYPERYDSVPKFQNQSRLGGIFVYTVGNGLSKKWENNVRDINIAYYLNDKDELDDLKIIYDKQVIDEKGDSIIEYNNEYNADNIYMIVQILFYDANLNANLNNTLKEFNLFNIDKEPISEKLKNKVKYKGTDKKRVFVDFFPEIDYNFGEFYFGEIKDKEEMFKLKKGQVVCEKFGQGKEPYYDEPEKIYLYEVDFQLDSENKLDDISVKYIKEMSYEEYLTQYD